MKELFTKRIEPRAPGKPEASSSAIQEIRRGSLEKSRAFVAKLLQKYRKDLGVCAVAGASALTVTSCGRSAFEVIPLEQKPGIPEMIDLPTYDAMREELEDALGKTYLEQELFPEATSEDELAAQPAEYSPVANMDVAHSWGISNEGMQKVMEGLLPSSWITKESIDSISIAPKPIPIPKQYGIEGYASGICEKGEGAGASIIRLSPEVKPGVATIRLLAHEAAHANDWKRSNVLSPEQRLTLLYLVHQRVQSSDRMKFSYVESIKNSNPQKQHLLKITEYWAKLMETRLSSDELDARATRGDERLMRWYFRDVVHSFVPGEGYQRIAEDVMREAVSSQLVQALETLPAGDIRANLTAFTHRPSEDDSLERRELKVIRLLGGISELPKAFTKLTEAELAYATALVDEQRTSEKEFRSHLPKELSPAVDEYETLREKIDAFRSQKRFNLSNPQSDEVVKDVVASVQRFRQHVGKDPESWKRITEACASVDLIDDARPVTSHKQAGSLLRRLRNSNAQAEGSSTVQPL